MNQIESAQAKIANVEGKNAERSGLASGAYFLILGTTISISLWFAARGVFTHHLAGINVAVIALVPLSIFDGMTPLPAAFSQLRQVLGAISNLEPMLVEAIESTVVNSPTPSAISLELIDLHPLIEGAQTRSINSLISPGDVLLITGRSGAGKSSIINAILGFLPFEGEILLNGRDLDPGDKHLFTTLLQDDYLFGTSIRENLKIGNPEASDEILFEALKLVELHSFVRELPDGLDTMVGPLGLNFSGGEKQRLKLARVLLRETPIVILDEPFEFLDAQMVERISLNVLGALRDKAVLVVSHLSLPIAAKAITL